MTQLPMPDVIITHESDLDGLLAGVLLQRLARKLFDTDARLEAYHYNLWKQRELREKLLDLSDARRAFGSGVELLRTSRKGAVNYGSIPELEGVDLEQYRKEPVDVVKINILARSE